VADDLDPVARQTHFFVRLAQRGGGGVGVFGLGPPAWETDLAGVVAKVIRAAGQQHVQVARVFDERNQHGGMRRCTVEADAAVAGELGLPDESVALSKTPAQSRRVQTFTRNSREVRVPPHDGHSPGIVDAGRRHVDVPRLAFDAAGFAGSRQDSLRASRAVNHDLQLRRRLSFAQASFSLIRADLPLR
jgi:hypothetical protein